MIMQNFLNNIQLSLYFLSPQKEEIRTLFFFLFLNKKFLLTEATNSSMDNICAPLSLKYSYYAKINFTHCFLVINAESLTLRNSLKLFFFFQFLGLIKTCIYPDIGENQIETSS